MPPVLAASTQLNTVTTADDGWYRSITSFAQHTAWLQGPMKLFTIGGIGLLVLIALYAWWSARARADRAAAAAVIWLGLGTVVSVAAGLGLKQVFQENRPCQAVHVVTVQPCPAATDYSFPSDHTIIAFALAVGILIVSRRLGVIAVVLAVIEGFSRVYLGQHYPHDVLAGALVSTAIMLVGWLLLRRPLVALTATLESTPLRPLLTTAPSGSAGSHGSGRSHGSHASRPAGSAGPGESGEPSGPGSTPPASTTSTGV